MILLLGKNGQIGWELQRTLLSLGAFIALDRNELDLSDLELLRKKVREIKPSIIVNAAAYTNVDQAEDNPTTAKVVNSDVPAVLAEETKRLGGLLVHYSTDYIFDGKKKSAYVEEDTPNPLNVYGETKLYGEKAIVDSGAFHIILRISWVYSTRGNNFLLKMLDIAKRKKTIGVVADQFGKPTWSRFIAETTAQILQQRLFRHRFGIYNLAAGGRVSWCNLAQKIFLNAGIDVNVEPFASACYPTKAARPKNSCLSTDKIVNEFGIVIPEWGDSLKIAMSEL